MKKTNALILVGLKEFRRVSVMKYRPYLTRLMARLLLLSILDGLDFEVAAIQTGQAYV